MRDLFDELAQNQPLDPTEAARRHARPRLMRRFYEAVTVAEGESGFALLLDGKPVKTPARRPLAAPNAAVADGLAAEWRAQAEHVDPATMPLTRLVNTIIDGVAEAPAAVTAQIEHYLGTDLVCYRADAPAGLVERQAEAWDPLVAWARQALGARFVLAEGITHVVQPAEAIEAVRQAIPADVWRLGALHSIVTLTGSALIGLAVLRGRLSAEAAWTAAHVDEDWNMQTWGRDALALERRAFRLAEMQAAATVLEAMR